MQQQQDFGYISGVYNLALISTGR